MIILKHPFKIGDRVRIIVLKINQTPRAEFCYPHMNLYYAARKELDVPQNASASV